MNQKSHYIVAILAGLILSLQSCIGSNNKDTICKMNLSDNDLDSILTELPSDDKMRILADSKCTYIDIPSATHKYDSITIYEVY